MAGVGIIEGVEPPEGTPTADELLVPDLDVRQLEDLQSTRELLREVGILTVDQAAAYLSIPKATLYTWRARRAGFGPRAVKIGGCLRYRRSDLDEWIAAHVENFDDNPVIPEPRAGDGVSLSWVSRPR